MSEKKIDYQIWEIQERFTNNLYEIKNDTNLDSLNSIFPIFYEMCDFISNQLTQIEKFYDSPSMKRAFSFYSEYEKFIHKPKLIEVGNVSDEEQKMKMEFEKIQKHFKENADEILTFFDIFKSADMSLKICLIVFEEKIKELESNLFSDTENRKITLSLLNELKKRYKIANESIEMLLRRNANLTNEILYITDLIQ